MLDGGANLALVGTPGLGGGGGVAAYLMGGKTAAAMTPVAVLPPECGVDLASATLSQLNGEVSMSFRLTVGGAAANCLVGGSSVRTLALPQNTPAQGVILARGATAAFDGHV